MKWFNLKKEKKELVEKYQNYKDIDLITYDELKLFEIGKSIEIKPDTPGAITTTRIPTNTSNTLAFRVTMKEGYTWAPHVHDCDETIVIYKGVCTDTINNRTADKRHHLFIPKGIPHTFRCDSKEAIFYVEFKKEDKINGTN